MILSYLIYCIKYKMLINDKLVMDLENINNNYIFKIKAEPFIEVAKLFNQK